MTSITSLKSKVKTKVKKLTVLFGSAAVMTLGVNASAMAASLYDVTELGYVIYDPYEANGASSINDVGQVVGGAYVGAGGGSRGFIWDSSTGIANLGTLPDGNHSAANNINNAGQVVGYSDSGYSANRAYLWSKDTGMIDLGTLQGGEDSTYASSINNAGQVVGESGYRAFLWNQSTGMTDLGTLPGESESHANDINDVGQIVGSSGNRAVMWNDNVITNLGTLPGGNYSHAYAINNAGQIVGSSSNSSNGNSRAVLWNSNGDITDLGTFADGTSSYANDINDLGQIVGGSGDRAVVWDSSSGISALNTLIDPSLGWTLNGATAINNKGQIVGYGKNKNDQRRAFLLTPKSHKPVPEPLTMGGTVIAGTGLAYLRRRQGRLRRSSKA